MYTRIVVPLDGSVSAEAALPQALSLATRWRASVELLTVVPTPEDHGRPERGSDLRAGARAYLAELLGRIRTAGFPGSVVTAVVEADEVPEGIASRIAETGADFVVMTTHGRGLVRRAWLGSVADGFLRRALVPLLLIRPPVEEGGAGGEGSGAPFEALTSTVPFRRILLPLDGSPAAERLLEITASLAGGEDTEFVLLRAIPPLLPGGGPYVPHVVAGSADHAMVSAAAEDYLEALASRVPVGRAVTRVATMGQPAVAILQVAEDEDVDLIAMSTAGRGGVARMLLGSVADKVVRGASVPVLVHRHHDGG